jgi:hypothetical protein
MLYVPFLAGTILAERFSWACLLLGLSVTFVFFGRESFVGWRRSRSRGVPAAEAGRLALIYLGAAALLLSPLIILKDLLWLVPIGLITLTLLGFNARQAVRREDRTIKGELLAIFGLTMTAPAAYYVASGVMEKTALWLWVLCGFYFASSVFFVKLRVSSVSSRKPELREAAWRGCAAYVWPVPDRQS